MVVDFASALVQGKMVIASIRLLKKGGGRYGVDVRKL